MESHSRATTPTLTVSASRRTRGSDMATNISEMDPVLSLLPSQTSVI